MSIPYSYSMIPRAWYQKITIRLQELYAGNFVLMTLKCLVDLEILALFPLPKFDSHIFGTTSQMLSAWMKINEVYHASMFTKSLFAFPGLIVPNFYWGILTGRGKLSIMRMKNNFGHSCPMTFELHFLWLPRYWITSLALIIWNQLAILWKFGLNLSSIFRYFFLHILKILHGLLVLFLKLFTLFFQIDYLFL